MINRIIQPITSRTAIVILQNFSSNKPKALQFPYLFGGLPTSQYFHTQQCTDFQHAMLSPEIDSVFINLYKKYLTALQTKDMAYLQCNVSSQLLEGGEGNWPAVSLVNPEAPITMAVERNWLIGNIGYDRVGHGTEMIAKKIPERFRAGLHYYEGYSTTDANSKIRDSQMVSLFSTRVYFKSKIKLIKTPKKQTQPSKNQSLEQLHMVQFESQKLSSKMRLKIRTILSRLLNFRNKQKFQQEMVRYMVGASPSSVWKIADVDKVLHGNLPKVVEFFSVSADDRRRKSQQD